MKFEHTQVFNLDGAIRGMRNPLESWSKSDSRFITLDDGGQPRFEIGFDDLRLAQKLISGGTEHRKFMRQIFICVDITAPIYWWKEADTYQIGVTKNSTSTMHKIASKPITIDCFELDDFSPTLQLRSAEFGSAMNVRSFITNELIPFLERLRTTYLDTKNKRVWKELIRWLPESWLQTRTVTMNYENVYSMIRQRNVHKLNEWSGIHNPGGESFIGWAKSLPYAKELLFFGLKEQE